MFRRQKKFFVKKCGQSFLEYTILIGVIVLILVTMTPMMKRGIQGIIKTTADQIGTQQNADQDFSAGYMTTSDAHTRTQSSKGEETLILGNVKYSYADTTETTSNAQMILGTTDSQN